jgi:hypothetical protein
LVFGVFWFVIEDREWGFLGVLTVACECGGISEEGCERRDSLLYSKDSGKPHISGDFS